MTTMDPSTDPYAYLGMIANADGSITRRPDFLPTCAADSDPKSPVLSKDIPISQQTNTWARLYLPAPPQSGAAPPTKLPLVVYYHGGGFVLCSAATSAFQGFCSRIAAETPALVVSVDYRLAPEHRLPAAYDDCAEALDWIRTTADEWVTGYADFSNCFLMGTSAGGNIAYHVGLRSSTCVDQLTPLKVQGVILHQPFFGGVERTPSEIRLADDKVLPPPAADLMWDLALPIGVDRDHEYSNPIRAVKLDLLEKVKNQGLRFLVTGCDGDPLVDRQIELVKMLKEKGVVVVQKFSDGGFHGCEIIDESRATILFGDLKKFVLNL